MAGACVGLILVSYRQSSGLALWLEQLSAALATRVHISREHNLFSLYSGGHFGTIFVDPAGGRADDNDDYGSSHFSHLMRCLRLSP